MTPVKSGFFRLTVRRLRMLRRFGHWASTDLVRAPGIELYAARQARKLAQVVQAGPATQTASFSGSSVPKIIWMYWAQGEAGQPHIVRRCVESWREKNPGWEVRVLDDRAATAAADLSDVPAAMPIHTRSDVLRLRLLKAHGGVWADATCFCHRSLDDWLPLHVLSGFFVFARPGSDRLVSNWFIAARPGDPIVSGWEAALTGYIRNRRSRPSRYFMTHYLLQHRIERDPGLQIAWERTAHLPASPAFALMSMMHGKVPLETIRRLVLAGLPVSKLSHKTALAQPNIDAALKAVSEMSGMDRLRFAS